MGLLAERFIDENIFYSEEANKYALEKTITKLEQVFLKIGENKMKLKLMDYTV